MKMLDQERAKFAWEKVQGQTKDYKNLVKSAPAMVMTNGLMQTLAFLKGKGKDHHEILLNHIMKWLQENNIINGGDFSHTMESLYKMDSYEYQMATEETIAILRWLRQFADAVIDGGNR